MHGHLTIPGIIYALCIGYNTGNKVLSITPVAGIHPPGAVIAVFVILYAMIKNIHAFIRNKPAITVGFLFAVTSLVFGTWVAAIPGIKQRLSFTDASLGLSLLLSPLGAITGMLLSRIIFRKISVGRWMADGYIVLCLLMVLQINAINRPLFWLALYLYGMVSFLNGVSANATVNLMEKRHGALYMSSCHAMYSLGGAVSAGIAALFFAIGVYSRWQIVIVAAILIYLLYKNRQTLLTNTEIIHHKSDIKLPSATILGISFICLVTFMAEGCVADWSALYFKEVLHTPRSLTSLGYAGFAIAMTVGRFNGDSIIARAGAKKIVIAGSLLSAAGFLIVSLSPVVFLSVAGYVLVGVGCSCIVPVLFRASANIPGVTPVEGFSMVTTGGLIGFLAGPSLIGILSEITNLSRALLLVSVMGILAAYIAWKNKFLGSAAEAPVEEEHEMYVTDQ
ncbi:MAG TPA: MFS transporter [Ferruginibacter sp.]|nr:MFS transporter [Ferruginibacter sp.]HMP21914.1 MFS transporter [Ferruginibacter sp.]